MQNMNRINIIEDWVRDWKLMCMRLCYIIWGREERRKKEYENGWNCGFKLMQFCAIK